MDKILCYRKNEMYSRLEFYANTTFTSQALCCKHYISPCTLYLDEYSIKSWLSAKHYWSQKYPHPLKPKIMVCSCNIAQIFLLYHIRCTERQALIKSQPCSCRLYIIVAIWQIENKTSYLLGCDADTLCFFHQSVFFK